MSSCFIVYRLTRAFGSTISGVKNLLLVLLIISPYWGCAQAPGWASATVGSSQATSGTSLIYAIAPDVIGNVFVTGRFTGAVVFGNTTLNSAGGTDLFVAKYIAATATWAWAQRAGGTGNDIGYGIAVSGPNVYVTGYCVNNTADANAVRFGGTGTTPGTLVQAGATVNVGVDLLVAKYTDNGPSATFNWSQVGGGLGLDAGLSIAVNGPSVYVLGYLTNNTADAYAVRFGGAGTTPGTIVQLGASPIPSSDIVLVKYTDNGPTASVGWTQVGGGTGTENSRGIAVSGTNVYIAGSISNNTTDANAVRFGGMGTSLGTIVQTGASTITSSDLIVAKYIDNGPSATLGWTQVAGGTDDDYGSSIAIKGASVYVTGYLTNTTTDANSVRFGGGGTVPGTTVQTGASATISTDLVVAKYTDSGPSAAFNWSQVGGGTGYDAGQGIVVSGTSVYATGYLTNNMADANLVRFGGGGTLPGTMGQVGASPTPSFDLVVAKYTDNGPTATFNWSQVGGGADYDSGYAIALSGQKVLAGGYASLPTSFGNTTISTPVGAATYVLAYLLDTSLTPLPVRPAGLVELSGLVPYPNPAYRTATVRVPASTGPATLTLIDALGRVVSTHQAAAGQDYPLDLAGLVPGVYTLRVQAGDSQAVRQLVVQ